MSMIEALITRRVDAISNKPAAVSVDPWMSFVCIVLVLNAKHDATAAPRHVGVLPMTAADVPTSLPPADVTLAETTQDRSFPVNISTTQWRTGSWKNLDDAR
jgi:hypothetical protein